MTALAQTTNNTAYGPLLVSSSTLNQVLAYDPVRGGFLGIFANSSVALGQAQGLAYGPDGNLYVASGAANTIGKFDGKSGAFLGTFASVPGSPVGLTFGPDGNLYAVTNNPDGVVRFRGSDGSSLGAFVSDTNTPLNTPFAAVFGADSNLYVTSTFGGTVLQFDGSSGAFLKTFATLPAGSGPTGILFLPDGGDLLVCDSFNAAIFRFDPVNGGAPKGTFASGSPLSGPSGLVPGPGNDVYVANPFGQNVVRYNSTTGALIDIFLPTTAYGPGGANFLAFAPPLPKPIISAGLVDGVVNAASYVGGVIAPGEMITVFGQHMGPNTLSPLQVNPATGYVSDYTAGTRILFNGAAGSMIYTQALQASVVAPYEISQLSKVQVQVEYLGQISDPVTINVAPAVPGIFSAGANGTGGGAILNSDGITLNTAAHPAAKGSVVSIYATGGGVTNPPAANGELAPNNSPVLQATPSATIGGKKAQVLYAGGSPGEILSLLQVNVLVPSDAPSGSNVPVVLTVGNASSQAGITMAIQ
jgi:uncharacterized protein (TIGR03437 family)